MPYGNGQLILTDRFRTGKAYTLWQASKLAGISTQSAKRWVLGYDESDRRGSPVFGSKVDERLPTPLMLSFLELVELNIVARLRKHAPSLKLDSIREAHRFAREEWGLPYPFASVNLLPLGGHLLSDFAKAHKIASAEWVALDLNGSPTLPGLVQQEVEQNLEYPDMFAGRWWPRGKSTRIVIDPHVAAGRPTIEGYGITVETVRRRWDNGETIRSLARDYNVSVDVLDQVLKVADIAA
jgi:uncharacterized protein (DUF433 family)